MPLEDIINSLANSVQTLENQKSQKAISMSRLESQGNLLSQTVVNPKQNIGAIILSGRRL